MVHDSTTDKHRPLAFRELPLVSSAEAGMGI